MTFARALLMFGAPSHRNETQLVSAAHILEVDAEFTHFPGLIIASFGDEETKSSQLHFAKSGGRLSLGNLHKLHEIYRAVVHDELSAKQAIVRLEDMIAGRPMFRTPVRLAMSFTLAMLICPIAFGGSFVDMFVAGLGSLMLASTQIFIASRKSVIYANVYEWVHCMFFVKWLKLTLLQNSDGHRDIFHVSRAEHDTLASVLLCCDLVLCYRHGFAWLSHP